jgi:hypothetical protein
MDKELDELLDSALDDFDRNKEEIKETESIKSELQASSITIEKTNINVEEETDLKESTIDDDMKLFEEIFSGEQSKETLKQFTDAMKMFKGEDPGMFKDFEKMMSTMSSDVAKENTNNLNLYEDDVDDDDDRYQTKSRATNTTNKVNLEQKAPLDKILEDMNKQFKNSGAGGGLLNEEFLLSQLNLDESSNETDDQASSLLMQPLISMLFSKDILYPSLQMMLKNYENYLETNKDKLNSSDFNKYSEQKRCIEDMCGIYENSKDTDSQEVKSSQQQKILDLLEKCGNPPAELVPEMNPFQGMGGNLMKDSCPLS